MEDLADRVRKASRAEVLFFLQSIRKEYPSLLDGKHWEPNVCTTRPRWKKGLYCGRPIASSDSRRCFEHCRDIRAKKRPKLHDDILDSINWDALYQ